MYCVYLVPFSVIFFNGFGVCLRRFTIVFVIHLFCFKSSANIIYNNDVLKWIVFFFVSCSILKWFTWLFYATLFNFRLFLFLSESMFLFKETFDSLVHSSIAFTLSIKCILCGCEKKKFLVNLRTTNALFVANGQKNACFSSHKTAVRLEIIKWLNNIHTNDAILCKISHYFFPFSNKKKYFLSIRSDADISE